MKGLLVKDLRLLLQRKRFFLIMAVWALCMSFTMEDTGFVVGWVTMLMALFSLSTLSYDEYDNSMPFLMSMPVTSKEYAIEKYLFGMICGIVGCIFSITVELISIYVKHIPVDIGVVLISCIIYIPLIMFMLAVCLPVEFKWGSDKGRTYMLLIYGIIFSAILLVDKFFPETANIVSVLDNVSNTAFTVFSTIFIVILFIASILLSIRIMKKKEF